MTLLTRCTLAFLTISSIIFVVALPALSEESVSAGNRGTLTVTFRYKGESISQREFKDRTTYDQSASIVCPVTAGDLTSTSSIMGPTEEQTRANTQVGIEATKEVAGIPPQTISAMKSLEAKMKECKTSGKSEQICGMQVMMAMQSNPDLMAGMDAGARGDTKGRDAATTDSYQPWFNEGCTGTMTVNNTFQLDDPTIPGPEPVIHTTGTEKIDTQDTLVTVETDLHRNETRYMIVPPQGSFHRDASYGEKPTQQVLAAIPANPLLIGPYTGQIKSGRYEKQLQGGSYAVDWTFTRGGSNLQK